MVLSTAFPSFTFDVACLAAFCSAYSLCGCTLPSGRHLQGASRQEQEGGWVMGVHQAAGRLMKHFKCYTTGDLWGRIPSMLLVHLTATVVIVKVPLARCGNGWQQAPYLPQSGKGLLFSCRQKSPEGHGGLKVSGGVDGHGSVEGRAVSPWKLQDWLTLRNDIQISNWRLLQWFGVW